jgi:hypothetical protein
MIGLPQMPYEVKHALEHHLPNLGRHLGAMTAAIQGLSETVLAATVAMNNLSEQLQKEPTP